MPGLIPNFFPSIIPGLQQTITIIHRTETGKDAYGKPIFTETTEEISGHFQVAKAEDTITELGIRVSRTADLYVSRDTNLDVDDQVIASDYPDIKWAVMGTPYKSSLQMEAIVREVIPQ